MRPKLRVTLGALLIGVITICAVLIARKVVGRASVDLTQQKLYTLSPGTRNVLAKLNEPIKLTLYYSRAGAMKGPEGIRYYNNYFLYVRDLLAEFAARSGGKLALNVIDPRPYSDEEEQAIQFNVRRFQISEDESFFFGLVAQTELGKDKVIPFFEPDRQEFAEYDIAKLIASLMKREKKKIGVLSSLPVLGGDTSPYMMQMMQMQGRQPERPWTISQQLRDAYEVESVETEAETIPEDVDFLMVVHPKNLSEKTLFAIDQYVMKGGRLIVLVDPHCIMDQPMRDPGDPFGGMNESRSSELNALLKGWGVEMDPGVIAADRALAITASMRPNTQPLPIVTFLNLNNTCVNKDEPITGNLHSLRMAYAGVLRKVAGAESTVTPLLQTTKTGTTWKPSSPFELQMPDPAAMARAIVDGTEPEMLGCRIGGLLKTNFPKGLKTTQEDAQTTASANVAGDASTTSTVAQDDASSGVVQTADPEAMVVVFADVDMIADILAYEETFFGLAQVGNNASLLLNTVDFLGGDADLITIRSRGKIERPFEVIERIKLAADKATEAKIEQVNNQIEEFQKKLNELGGGTDQEDITLIASKALAERQALEGKIRLAQKQLKELNAQTYDEIERLKLWYQTLNMALAPAIILLIAIALMALRSIKARRYAARRASE